MAIKGALGTTLGISATKPATKNEAGYEGLTFTDCGEVINIGEFGREYNVVRVNNLASGATRKFKGSYDNGSFSAELLFDSADAGQTILEQAETSTATYAFRVGLPPGDTTSDSDAQAQLAGTEEFYFEALVTSVKRIPGGPDDAIMLRINVELDHNSIVEGT